MELGDKEKRKLMAAAELVEKGEMAVLQKILEFQDILEDFKEEIDEKLAQKLFWLFLFALITFWGGLSAINDSFHTLGHTIYLLINLFLLVIAVILQRRFFAILGAIGVFWYVADLSPNSIWFSLILVATGFLIMLVAYYWSKIEGKLVNNYRGLLPERLRAPH